MVDHRERHRVTNGGRWESLRYTTGVEPELQKSEHFIDQDGEWLNLTPEQRFEESGKLWELYLAMGGSLDPEPDPQSPFYYPEMQFATTPSVEVTY